MFNISNEPDRSRLILILLCFPKTYNKKVKTRSKMAFFHVFCPFQTMFQRFRRRRRRNLGQYARSLRTSFCCSKTYIKMVKKGQKQVKMAFFIFFCPFQTISRRFRRRRRQNHGLYARSPRTAFRFSITYINRSKMVKNRL